MYKIILFICFLMLHSPETLAQKFWEKINSPTSKPLNSIVFIDSINGWVSSDSGLIIHTSNGGENWETQFSNDSLNVVDIFFLNDKLGWGSAWSSYNEPFGTFKLTTKDGGIYWNSEYLRIDGTFVNSFYFLDSLTGFAVGYPQIFQRTSDGGLSWANVNLDSSLVSGFPPYKIKFYSPQYGYACGGVRDIAGVVWKTTDSGISWSTVVDALISEPLYDIQMFDSLNVIAMGGDFEYGTSQIITSDGGNSWEYKSLGNFYFPVNIGFRTAKEGWAPLGGQKKFLYTSDAGENWTEVSTPDSLNITHICFPDSSHGYGIGANGAIVKYIPQAPTNLVEAEQSISNFYLQQNYPNPFNPTTSITYSIPEEEFVSLAIYNMLGEKVEVLVNSIQQRGRHNVVFTSNNLSSGVYIYRLDAGNYSDTKKLILIK